MSFTTSRIGESARATRRKAVSNGGARRLLHNKVVHNKRRPRNSADSRGSNVGVK
jgi:hypothetical protein